MKINNAEFYPDFNTHGPFMDGRNVQTGVLVHPDGKRQNVTLQDGNVVHKGRPYRRVRNADGLWTNVLA